MIEELNVCKCPSTTKMDCRKKSLSASYVINAFSDGLNVAALCALKKL